MASGYTKISFPHSESFLLASLGLTQGQQDICSPSSLLLVFISSPCGPWLCIQVTSPCWQWNLSQYKAEPRLSQLRSYRKRTFDFALPAPNMEETDPQTTYFSLQNISPGTVLEPFCSCAIPSPVSASLQLNKSCTRCSERHQHQPQEQTIFYTFLDVFI